MKNINYCDICQNEAEYEIIDVNYEVEYENILVKYHGKKAICKDCGNEVFSEEVEEYNQKAFEAAYIKQNEIIQVEEIDEILKKYNIGKRPLSLLLGWGEITISRYYQNYIPSIKNSKILKEILNDPKEYYKYLMANKNNISSIAYRKSKNALDIILGIKESNGLEDENITKVSRYIISAIDASPMALQKLLYYIQVFYSYFFKKLIFISKCSAWEHGPVFGKIYYEYKEYGYRSIRNDDSEKIELEDNLKRVVDNVIKYFGCYSAKALEFFTHNEEPWLNSIGNKNGIIEKSCFKEFGEKIVKENNIASIEEIYKYSNKMINKYLEYTINN